MPPAVVLTLDVRGDVPEGVAVIDLLGRRVHGSGGVVLDSVREFCRKRGIKLEPGPWKLPGRPRLNGGARFTLVIRDFAVLG